MFYELETTSNRNRTTLTYTIDDPDSSWDDALIRCEQIYTFAKNSHQAVTARLHVHCEWHLVVVSMKRSRERLALMSADANECSFGSIILEGLSIAILIDLDKPRVRIESQNRHPLTINATATFRCIVHGNPEPQFRYSTLFFSLYAWWINFLCRWFANSMDLTALTSPIINIPLSKHVHNHSIGCSATNSIGTTNTSIRLLIRCKRYIRPVLIGRIVVSRSTRPVRSSAEIRGDRFGT